MTDLLADRELANSIYISEDGPLRHSHAEPGPRHMPRWPLAASRRIAASRNAKGKESRHGVFCHKIEMQTLPIVFHAGFRQNRKPE